MIVMVAGSTVLAAVSSVQAFASSVVGVPVPPFFSRLLIFSLYPIFLPLFFQIFPLLLSGSLRMSPSASP